MNEFYSTQVHKCNSGWGFVWHFVNNWYRGILGLKEYQANAWPVSISSTPKMPRLPMKPLLFLLINPNDYSYLVEEPNDLASNVLPASLLVVHNTGRSGQDDVAELTRRQQLDNPLLEVGKTDVVPGRDNTSLVQAAIELHDDLAGSVVINLLEFTDVTYRRSSVSWNVAKD